MFTKKIEAHRIKSIDAWRFIAVSLVICGHLILATDFGKIFHHNFGPWLHRLTALGVLIFFFISGYVICNGLLVEKTKHDKIHLSAFYVRRFFRIIPALAIYLLARFALSELNIEHITHLELINAAFFLCNLYPYGGCESVGHLWSLAYEEQFYLVFPLIFIFLAKLKNAKLSFLIILLAMLLSSTLSYIFGYEFSGFYSSNMIFLLTGVVCALYKSELLNYTKNAHLLSWCGVALLLLVMIYVFTDEQIKFAKIWFFPFAIAYLVLTTPIKITLFKSLFENSFICYLGRISYTAYLWQQLATTPVGNISVWWYPLMCIGVWLWAGISFKIIEMPLIAIGSRISNGITRR